MSQTNETNGEKSRKFALLLPVLAGMITILGSVFTWYLNERSERVSQEYSRRVERYSNLVTSMRGFYAGSTDKTARNEFYTQIRLCWLYCPDEVIRRADNFVYVAMYKEDKEPKEANRAFGELMVAIREDLIARRPLAHTELKPEDFNFY